ncbi:hypothetical protein Patl1_24829 [Pistacia atlantica]|uniref:Uncharacterized protein n=1 Tax=Pistacia atlantica TaxID=434234 RepID=A0ACC1B3S5_9ROSI|nr:hypothetical protein Patl1_24829 [Pistacia atlantica]
MDSLLQTTSATSLASKLLKLSVHKQSNSFLTFARKSVIVSAKKSSKKDTNKEDTHSFFAKPEEDSLFFPEAVLLKEKKVQEDGRVLPEFADAEEEELYEFLNLQLQSEVSVDRMRHYEVVYLIHEKHAEEVGSVNEKVQDFLREKKGKIWRFNDWGLRRLAYKIQKAKNAHYILMNFELEAKYINEFKTMLDKDERIWQGYDDDDEDSDYDDAYDDEDEDDTWDGEGEEMDGYDDVEDGVVIVNVDDDNKKQKNNKSPNASALGGRNLSAEKVSR